MSWMKLIAINVMVSFALFFAVLLSVPTIHLVYDTFLRGDEREDARGSLALYSNYDWAKQYFRDHSRAKLEYRDYIVWRHLDFSSNTVNIKDGVRKTVSSSFNPPDLSANSSAPVWFFGGSTTYGAGVNDANTYPSVFAQRTGRTVTNYGEVGYVAQQSLNYLQSLYIEGKGGGKTIVFYDGVNEVLQRCRDDTRGLATVKEATINNTIEEAKVKFSYGRFFGQFLDFVEALKQKTTGRPSNPFVYSDRCNNNEGRAQFVARSLVKTWLLAKALAESQGDKFVAILQPSSEVGTPILDYLDFPERMTTSYKAQYAKVYPLVLEYAKAEGLPVVDLSDAYDGCSNCYIDISHVGPQAHQMLVERMAKIIP